MRSIGMQQKQLAERVGMTPDALSRALSGHRGFAAIEIAEIATVLGVSVHELITGEPDPHRLVLAARHAFDHKTGERRVDSAAADRAALEDVRLAYIQAGRSASVQKLPADVEAIRNLLHPDFVPSFSGNLAGIGVDVVRFAAVSTSYCFTVEDRPVIVLPETGNWFWENWALAHELGHLALGHDDVMPGQPEFDDKESAANAFAAQLLLPEARLRAIDWSTLSLAGLAEYVWAWGISTDALSRRLSALGIDTSPQISEVLSWSTQKLLRRYWTGARIGDPISKRMVEAGKRRFPSWLQEAHLEGIARGRLGKGTLAWMLGVPAESLEVDQPDAVAELSDDSLDALLG